MGLYMMTARLVRVLAFAINVSGVCSARDSALGVADR